MDFIEKIANKNLTAVNVNRYRCKVSPKPTGLIPKKMFKNILNHFSGLKWLITMLFIAK